MSLPTTKDMLAIHSKGMADATDAQYITERIEAGCGAVRDAVLDALIAEADAKDEEHFHNHRPIEIAWLDDDERLEFVSLGQWLRHLKGGK